MAVPVLGYVRRGLAAIGHEVAETIRFGAVPASVTTQSQSPMGGATNPAGVVAGLGEATTTADRLSEPENAQPSEG
jgi:hypothetical protein